MPMGRKRKREKNHSTFCFIVDRGRTRTVFPSVLTVKVTKKISNRKNFNGQTFSGRIDQGLIKIPNRLE